MDGMFEDFLSPDEIPHKVLYYMPFWHYVRVFSIQVMVVFWSGLGPDQLKLICYVELGFCLASFTANQYHSLFLRWQYRLHTSCLFLINFFFLLNEYTAENSSPAEKSAYSIVISIFVTIFFVNAVVSCGWWTWIHLKKAQEAQLPESQTKEEEEEAEKPPQNQTEPHPEQEQPRSSDRERADLGLNEHPHGYNRKEINARRPLPSKHAAQILQKKGHPEKITWNTHSEEEVAQEQLPFRDDTPVKRMQMVKSHHLSGMS